MFSDLTAHHECCFGCTQLRNAARNYNREWRELNGLVRCFRLARPFFRDKRGSYLGCGMKISEGQCSRLTPMLHGTLSIGLSPHERSRLTYWKRCNKRIENSVNLDVSGKNYRQCQARQRLSVNSTGWSSSAIVCKLKDWALAGPK